MTTAAISPVTGARTPGFFDTLASEWTKLKSVRSTYIEALLTVVLGIGMTALICLAIGSTWGDLNPEDQATFDPAATSAFGTVFALVTLVVLGITFVSSEYTSGMVRLTFTTTPRRMTVLWAKVALITLVCWVLGFFVSFGAFFAGQAVLGSYEGVPTASLSDGDALRAVLGVWLTMPVFPLLGAAAAVVLRSTASTITAILAILFIPAMFGGLFPDSIQENVLAYLPGFALDSLSSIVDEDSNTYLEPGVAAVVVAGWLVGFFFAAYISLTRRDV